MGAKICRRWTEEEKEFVMEHWGDVTVSYIAKKLNRSETAIISFSEKNKLGSAYKKNYISTIDAGEIIGVDQTTIIHWINSCGLKAEFKAIKNRKKYLIDIDKFHNFLRDNQGLWKASNLELYGLGKEEDWLKVKRKKDDNEITKKQGSPWTLNEIKRMNNYIEEGLTLREIANILNRTYYSVRQQRQRQLDLIKQQKKTPA